MLLPFWRAASSASIHTVCYTPVARSLSVFGPKWITVADDTACVGNQQFWIFGSVKVRLLKVPTLSTFRSNSGAKFRWLGIRAVKLPRLPMCKHVSIQTKAPDFWPKAPLRQWHLSWWYMEFSEQSKKELNISSLSLRDYFDGVIASETGSSVYSTMGINIWPLFRYLFCAHHLPGEVESLRL